MNTYVIWVDMDEAKIFKVSAMPREAPIHLHRTEVKHHTPRDPENHKDCEKFFHSVAFAIRDADEIFLTGPSLAKGHFRAHLQRHHHLDLAEKVVGTWDLDRASDNQILEQSRIFFRAYGLYGRELPA